MVEIVHLKKGESPPKGQRTLLIDVVSNRGTESASDGPNGVVLKVFQISYAETLAGSIKKAEAGGLARIYVRGAPTT